MAVTARGLVWGWDYQATFAEFHSWFSDEDACVHRVASLLKRWGLGTHQGGVSIRQLDYYLDEFVFRLNRRTSPSGGTRGRSAG